MKSFFILAVMLCGLHAMAQPGIEWNKVYGSSYTEDAHSIATTPDGGYIVAGRTNGDDYDVTGFHDNNPGASEYDMWIVKLHADGGLQWEKALGDFGDDEAASIQTTTGGGYIVAGISGGFLAIPYIILFKLDDTGGTTWTHSYGGTQGQVAKCVRQTTDGGYVFCGYTSSTDGDVTGNHGGNDAWVVKTDDTGAIVWQKCFGGTLSETANDIRQTADGGYIVACASASADGDVTGHHGTGDDFWIIKLDAGGNLQWQKSLGGTLDEEPYSIITTADGYAVAGGVKSADGDATGTHPGPVVATYDIWLVKLDNTGTLQWQKTIGGSNDDVAYSLYQSPDGGYVMAGTSNSNSFNIADNHGGAGEDDMVMVKVNNTGSLIWERTYGGTGIDRCFAMAPNTDGSYVMAGVTSSNNDDVTPHTYGSYWIVKTAAPTAVPLLPPGADISLYPNPAASTVMISSAKPARYTLSDIAGRSLLQGNIETGTNTIDISSLAPGTYLLHTPAHNYKLVKE